MSDFDELVHQAEVAPIEGWDFGWLDGRAVEDRPSWHYFEKVAERAATEGSLLEIEAGDGAMTGALPVLPSLAVATEGFAPSVARAAPRLQARSVHLVRHVSDARRAAPWWRSVRAGHQPASDRTVVG
jgi:hypothetical protein